jgi:hypothetical protein
MSTVTTASKTTARTVHPQHPARTATANDSGTIVTNRPGQAGQKLTNGVQTGGTKEGEVFSDFA